MRANTNRPIPKIYQAVAELIWWQMALLSDFLCCFQKQNPWCIQERLENVPSSNCILPSRPLHSKFPCWDTGKSHPTQELFRAVPWGCHPHKLPFVILVFYLLLLALGCNFLLMVFRVAKGFLLSLLLSGLGSARKHERLKPRMMLTIVGIVSLHYFYRKQWQQ